MPGCDVLWRRCASVEKRLFADAEAAADSQGKQLQLMEGSSRASLGKRGRFRAEAPYKKDKEVENINRKLTTMCESS